MCEKTKIEMIHLFMGFLGEKPALGRSERIVEYLGVASFVVVSG